VNLAQVLQEADPLADSAVVKDLVLRAEVAGRMAFFDLEDPGGVHLVFEAFS